MSIELSLLILVTALLVLITAQLRAIAVMIRETLEGVDAPATDKHEFAESDARPVIEHPMSEHTPHLTLVK